MKRIVVLVLMAAAVWSAENGWLNLQQGESARRLAVAQLNGGDPANRALRRFDTVQNLVPTAAMLLTGMTALWALAPVARGAGRPATPGRMQTV